MGELELSDLMNHRAEVEISYHGQSFTVVYAPERYTNRIHKKLQQLVRSPDFDPIVEVLCDLVLDWSLTLNGERLPPDHNAGEVEAWRRRQSELLERRRRLRIASQETESLPGSGREVPTAAARAATEELEEVERALDEPPPRTAWDYLPLMMLVEIVNGIVSHQAPPPKGATSSSGGSSPAAGSASRRQIGTSTSAQLSG